MQDTISPNTYARLLSTNDLKKLIHKSLVEGLTGRIHVTFQTEKTLTLFAHQGRIRQVYVRNHRIPSTNWEIPLTKYGRGDFYKESIPSRGLMFRKIMLEELEKIETQPSSTGQLKVMFDLAAQNNTNPTLFHILWDSAEAFVLVAGRDIPIHHAIMLTKDGVAEGLAALEQVKAWDDAACKVSVHRGNIKSQAWFEVHLNILLEYFCSRILHQYGRLTGKVMIRSIIWKIHTMSVEAGWDIKTQDNEIRDGTIFPTARDAGDAYRKIISEMVAHIDPLIGHALTQNILTQTFNSTKGTYKTIAEVFDLLGEEFS